MAGRNGEVVPYRRDCGQPLPLQCQDLPGDSLLVSDTQWGRKFATLDKASYMAAELTHLHV